MCVVVIKSFNWWCKKDTSWESRDRECHFFFRVCLLC